jgi:hypothetical protein
MLLLPQIKLYRWEDYCLIWEVFAAQGLGVNASAGDANIGNDQVERILQDCRLSYYWL